jgi:hypothetical protein
MNGICGVPDRQYLRWYGDKLAYARMCEYPLPISLILVTGELASDQTHEERKRHDAELQVPSVSRYYVPGYTQRDTTYHMTLDAGSFNFETKRKGEM